jgi:hypothetical protein
MIQRSLGSDDHIPTSVLMSCSLINLNVQHARSPLHSEIDCRIQIGCVGFGSWNQHTFGVSKKPTDYPTTSVLSTDVPGLKRRFLRCRPGAMMKVGGHWQSMGLGGLMFPSSLLSRSRLATTWV